MYSSYAAADTQRGHSRTPSRSRSPSRGRSHSRSRSRSRSSSSSGGRSNNSHHRKSSRHRRHSRSRSTSRSGSRSRSASASASSRSSRSHSRSPRRRSRKSRSHSRSRSRSHSPRSGSDDEGEYKYDPNGPHPLAHLYTHSSIHISAAQFLPRAAGPSREPGGYWRDKERAKQQNNTSGFAPPRDYFQAQQRGRGGGGYYSREGPAPPPPGYGWPPPNPYGMPPLPFGAPPHMPFPYGHPGAMPAMMGAGVPPVAAAVGLPPPPPHHGHHHHHHLHHHNAPQQQQQYSNNSRTNPFAAPGGIGRPSLLVNVEHDVAIELAIPLGPLIEREFIFKREASAHIPRVEDLFHESIQHDQRLQSMKDELNGVKSHLDTLDLKSWGKHTDFTNVCSRIAPAVRTAASPEMCTGAFIKMYEMLKSYEIIPNAVKKGNQSQVNTVHLCEAPGGFISATNHYLRNEVSADTNWNWKAVSLNPYHEGNDLGAMIDDDRMMLETKSHWMFGRDNTGDIREIENIRDFWKVAREMGPIHAVTADGSISCADEPNEQESHTAQLHYCEMVCALGLLAKGGSIVLKTFTFFEHTSLNMLYLLHTLFDSLIISKPACSKAGNSETYIVAVGFQGIDPELLETLLSFCGSSKPKTMMLSRDFIGANFIRQATVMAEFFSRCSAAIIERNLSLFNNMDRHARGATEALKTAVANEFIRRFNFRPLPVGCYRMFGSGPSLDGSKLQLGRSVQQGRENRGGSLLDRQSHKRKAEESKEELGIVSVATKHTLGGVKEEEEEGEDSAENESAADGQQPPTKKAKRGGIGSDATMLETSAEGGESSGSSSTMLSTVDSVFDSTPAAPTSIDPTLYSTAAQRMMAKMGYKPGQGLGAKEQGIAQPIQASTQVGQQGLGFMNAEEFVRFLQAPSAFTNTSSSSSDGSSSSSNFVLPMTDNEVRFSPRVQEWLIEGRVPKLLSLSKFCDTEILKSMAEIRSSLLMPANRGTFLSSNFSHRNFPTYFLGGAKSIFSNPVALEIAELDLLFEISSKLKQSFAANGETLRVFEMHTAFEAAQVGKGFGATEYFSKKFDQENVKVAFEILPSFLDPASPSAASSSSSSSAASIPSLSIPTTTSSTVDVLLDSNESVVAAAGSTFPLSADKIVLLHAQQASNLIDVENKSHLVLAHAQRVFSFESSSLNWNVVENYISLTQLLSCLSHLELGGVLLLRTTDLLSRFSAGLLYTLDLLFNNVAVLKTATMAPAEPEKWIYAAGFSGLPTPLKEYMQKIEKNYKDMLAAGTLDFHHPSCLCLLEFIPMDLLLQRYYWSYLLETNDRLVGAEVKDGRRALATIVDKKDEAVESSDNATKRTRIGKEVREKLTTWLTGKVPEYV